jgi:ligand-binding sensor domain-containing protein/signal transduction histidine kinase
MGWFRPSRPLLLLLLAAGSRWPLDALAQGSANTPIERDQIRFRSVGIREGLSSSTARALAQDERGFVWLGTQDGLNRFDGYRIRIYRADSERPDSLSDSHVTALAADGKGTLWVGTIGGGINRLDLAREHIVRFLEGGPQGLVGTQVNTLMIARDGALWTATQDGAVQRLAQGSTRFESVLPQDPRLRRVRAILQLKDGDLLLGGASGLLRYSPGSGTLREWASGQPAADSGWNINALSALPDGRIFAGDNALGLLEFGAMEKLLAHHRPGSDPSSTGLVSGQVLSLMTTSQGELWVGTYNGLSRYQGEGRFLSFTQDATDIGSIGANRIPAMMEDKDGLLWFGTWTAGVSLHKPATRALRLIRHRASNPRSIPTNPTRALFRDKDGTLWFGLFEGGGLVHYDLRLGVLRRYLHDPTDPRSLPGNGVQSILRRRNGELWVATSSGVARLDPSGKGFMRAEGPPLKLPTRSARILYETRDGTLWIGTEDQGVLALCSSCSSYVQYTIDPELNKRSLPGSSINGLFEDREGMFWIGMNGTGLVRLDRKREELMVVRARRGEKGAMQSDVVTTFFETKNGELWMGTQGAGISRIDRGPALSFFTVTTREGLSANAIGSVIEDQDAMLWVSSIGGIDEYDRRTGRVRALTASDGFDRSGYFLGSSAIDAEGVLLFGGLLGVVQFHPRDFQLDRRPARVVLTGVDIYRAQTSQDRREASIGDVDTLRLDHTEPVWSLSFSTMNYANVETVRFSYQLEGLNDDWIALPKGQRMASFTHVPPGSYTFRVRAANADGLDYGPETRVPVAIAPPPWWSLQAKLFYGAVFAGLLSFFTRSIRRRSRERGEAVREIAEREHRLKLALWGSRDELWDLDVVKGTVRRENPLPNLAPVPKDDVEHLIQLVHPEDLSEGRLAMTAHMRGETEFGEMTYRARDREGSWFWVLTRGQVVERGRDGSALRMIGTHRDITSIKAAEEALRASNEALESRVIDRTSALTAANADLQSTLGELQKTQDQLIESEKMASLGSLVAGVAHEINTPLGIGITAASHLETITEEFGQRVLESPPLGNDLSRYMDDAAESSRLILKNLQRAGQLVRSFKQVAVDQSREERRVINLADYLDEVAYALRPALKGTGHELRIDCPPDVVINTYPGAIYQIVVNLVSNALAHAFPGEHAGVIELQARTRSEGGEAPSELVLECQDNGMGVEPAFLKRIFEPFFTTRRNQGGSGLGLHIVYNLVTHLLGGSITVENRAGLHFVIRFPLTHTT